LRRLVFVLLVAALVGLAWLGWRSSGRVDEAQQEAARYEAATGWPLVQARLEYSRFLTALARHVAGDPALDYDSLLERFEIFWSRVTLLDTEVDLAITVDGMTLTGLRQEGMAVLEGLEPVLLGRVGARGDMALLGEVTQRLAPLVDRLQAFLLEHHISRRRLYGRTLEAIDGLGRVYNLTLAGMVTVAYLLLVLALAEAGGARRAEAQARAEAAAARRAEERFRHFADSASDWLWETDAAQRVTFVSERWRAIFGLDETEILGRPWSAVAAEPSDGPAWQQHRAELAAGRPFRRFAFAHRAAGPGPRTAQLAAVPIHDAEGRLLGHRGVGTDITDRLAQERRIAYLARHDAMTGLLNRVMLQEELGRALAVAAERGQEVALLLIDLDGFKAVNDAFGHDVGDRLIGAVAERLTAVARASDTLGRCGGDEFALVIGPQPAARASACGAAERLVGELTRPFALDGQKIAIGASIGIALYPQHADSLPGLLKAADLALYRVKAAGRCGYLLFANAWREELLRRRALERDLAAAIAADEIELLYQPVMRATDRVTVGVEALARWHHPRHGPIEPARFVPIAEETGQIRALGRLVLRRACRDAAAWRGPLARLSVAVNLSPLHFAGGDVAGEVTAVLAESGLAAERLVLEITETTLLRDHLATRETLAGLRRLGVRIAIDDFGTGYSSLSYLRLFPVDKLKLDQAFVRDLEGDKDDRAILAAMIALGRTLGLTVVAEGVETEDQLAYLVEAGCDEVQGFLLGRPVTAEALVASGEKDLLALAERQGLGPRAGALDRDVAALDRGALEGVEHLEHVQRQIAARPVRPARADRRRHVQEADDPVVGDHGAAAQRPVGRAERMRADVECLPHAVARADLHLAAEEVRVGREHAALAAVELERQALVLPDVPRRAERDVGAARERQHAVDRGRHLDLDHLPFQRLAGHRAGGEAARGLARDPDHRAQQVDQLGDVVGADVVDRPAAALEEEVGVGVPGFHAVAEHGGGAGDDAADPPGVERAPARLMRGAEEGVGRAADAQPLGGGDAQQRLRLVEARGERLLRVDVLAGLDDLPADRPVRHGHGEVDHGLDLGIGEERVDRHRGEAELRRPGLGRLAPEIGTGLDADQPRAGGALEIGLADVAAADDADGHGLHRVRPPCR
jgi:diguanylate cyclase (GGDEF)-like protein/PAS domain S-box-containing protein